MTSPKQSQAPISLSFAIGRSAVQLMSSQDRTDRAAGRALLHAEALGVLRGASDTKHGRQGVVVHIGCSVMSDLETLKENEERVAEAVSRALGMWPGAAQAKFVMLRRSEWANAVNIPEHVGGRRLDRYLTDSVAASATGVRHDYLVRQASTSRILLRRIRYRPTYDFAPEQAKLNLAVWSTPTTHRWAKAAQAIYQPPKQNVLQYLPFYLLGESAELTSMHVDVAFSSPDDWGSVDTELEPLRVLEVTTRGGVTTQDVASVFDHAGGQIITETEFVGSTNRHQPIVVFNETLEHLTRDTSLTERFDVVLIHRGGGLIAEGRPTYSTQHREALTRACEGLRDLGLEVVVALGHGDTALLADRSESERIGIIEASTPTAGAAWIVKEHINASLIPDDLMYIQPIDASHQRNGRKSR